MKIIHISSECYPAAKVGGLADVVGSLPKYQKKLGNDTMVVMPHYHSKFRNKNRFVQVFEGRSRLGTTHHNYPCQVFKLKNNELGYDLYSIDLHGLFDRENVYSYNDDTERFITFQIAALNWICSFEELPDIIHCHDQHTGFIPFLMSKVENFHRLRETPSIFTIHNGEYQGRFGFNRLNLLPGFPRHFESQIEWHGHINPIAAGIKNSWKVTTVSPNYMNEIQGAMAGLEGLLEQESHKSMGVLNGIDTEVWDPATDNMLVKNYTLDLEENKTKGPIENKDPVKVYDPNDEEPLFLPVDGFSVVSPVEPRILSVEEGKAANKKWLCKEYNLDPEKPLFAFIGRFAHEKGADLLPDAIFKVMSDYRGEQNILVLGSGDGHLEGVFLNLEHQFEGNYCSYIGYNEQLAHRIYAGADFLLMPSRVEPCGLNQLYSLRYGTVPIVRRTGGLADTVSDIGDGGFGICHELPEPWDIAQSINRARNFYYDKEAFAKNRQRIMQIDHSWERAAKEYLNLYKSLRPVYA